jgi:hypothetical protein
VSFDSGDTSKEYVYVSSAAGALMDPVTLQLVVTEPDGTANTYTWAGADITKEAVGVFYREITLNADGVWELEWTSSAPTQYEQRYLVVGEPSSGPFDDWIGAAEVFECAPCSAVAEADRDYGKAGEAAAAASRTLYVLSGRKYPGILAETVRPCRRARWSEGWVRAWNPTWGWCGCGAPRWGDCDCGASSEIELGGAPVLGVTEVLVDGTALASSAYRVDGRRVLRRIDGQGWPLSQDLDLATTEPDTFSVSFVWGRTPPADGIIAARALACDYYQACAGGDCNLPSNVQSLAAQGVTLAFEEVDTLFDKGRTGIRVVDRFLDAEHFAARTQPTLTVSPDSVPAVRSTG